MNSLINSYLWFCRKRREFNEYGTIIINDTYLTPTQILPLCNLLQSNGLTFDHLEIANSHVHTYLSNILTRGINNRSSNSYVPFTEIPKDYEKGMKIIDIIFDLVKNELAKPGALQYVIGELVDNIYEHSEFSNAYVMAQKLNTDEIELCFFDNGVTIPSNFANHGIDKPAADCIYEAINGRSTKKEKGRGKGLNTSINMCKSLFNAEFLIVSKDGILRLDKNPSRYNPKDNAQQLQGTLIGMKCQIAEPTEDFYNYVDTYRKIDCNNGQ